MNIISLLMTLLGIAGIGYGLRTMLQKKASVYWRKQMCEFEGQAAQLVGIGIVSVGAGALVIGLWGWGMVFFGLIGATLYFAMIHLAERQAP